MDTGVDKALKSATRVAFCRKRTMTSRGIIYSTFLSTFLISFCWKCEGRRMFMGGRRHGSMLGNPKVPPNITLPPDEWFEQQLDHSKPTDTRTWQQRYFTNASFHVPGGPVFLMIGGEGTASPTWMVEGEWIKNAEKYNALCFQLEHRYYGLSHPTRNLGTKYLEYLTSDQALGDLAYFIQGMTVKHELPPETKWIAFGGSYPGSLAAWLRAKYPHLVHAAVSASGPLMAKADFREYFRIVKDDLSKTNASCVTAVQEAYKLLHVLMKTSKGQDTINKLFSLCEPIDVLERNDVASFYSSVAQELATTAQYTGDNREGVDNIFTLKSLCELMLDESLGPPVHRLAKIVNVSLTAEDEECLDYKYENYISHMKNTDWQSLTATGGDRQWMYQSCTEFGFFQTSTLTVDLFGDEFPLEFYIQECSDIFGSRYDKEQLMRGIKRTNTIYGALDQEASRVVYTHGSYDPWHALGITKTIHKDSPAIYIKGVSHCADMYPASPSDPPDLVLARKMISDLIELWLDEGKENMK